MDESWSGNGDADAGQRKAITVRTVGEFRNGDDGESIIEITITTNVAGSCNGCSECTMEKAPGIYNYTGYKRTNDADGRTNGGAESSRGQATNTRIKTEARNAKR
ncbi:TPA: hypothetical protein ACNVP4_006707, partial [Pseudomonas aeruginosa]